MNNKCYLICGHSKDYIRYTADLLSGRGAEHINIAYSPEGSNFNSFGNMYSLLQYKAHYANLYEGTLIADISPWAAHEHEEYFDVLLSFFSDHKNTIYTVFTMCLPSRYENADTAAEKINQYFDTEVINTCNISRESAVSYIAHNMSIYGIEYTQKDTKCLEDFMKGFVKDTDADKLCRYIIKRRKLTAESLQLFREHTERSSGYTMGLLGEK